MLQVANQHNREQGKDGSNTPRINLIAPKCWEEPGETQQLFRLRLELNILQSKISPLKNPHLRGRILLGCPGSQTDSQGIAQPVALGPPVFPHGDSGLEMGLTHVNLLQEIGAKVFKIIYKPVSLCII